MSNRRGGLVNFGTGEARSALVPPADLTSAYDRAPDRRVIPIADVAALPANGQPTGLKLQNFAPWAGWIFVEDDGGAALAIFPGKGGGIPSLVNAGSVVWVGNNQCRVAFVGSAPTTKPVLIGCTHADALLYAMAAAAAAGSSGVAADTTNGPDDAVKEGDPNYLQIAGSAAGRDLVIQSVLSNNAAELLWLADFATQNGQPANAGVGFPVSTGGTFPWRGVLFVGATGGFVQAAFSVVFS